MDYHKIYFNPTIPLNLKQGIKLILILILSGLSINTQASTLDSLIVKQSTCNDPYICFYSTLEICNAAIETDTVIFDKYAKQLLAQVESIDQNAFWVEALTNLGKGYRIHNEFATADSLLNLANNYAVTKDQLYDVCIEWANIKMRMGLQHDGLKILDKISLHMKHTDSVLKQAQFYMIRGRCSRDYEKNANAIKDFIKVKELTANKPSVINYHKQAKLYLSQIYLAFKSYDRVQQLHIETRESARESGNHIEELFATYPIILSTLQLKEFDKTIEEGHQAIRLKNEQGVSTAFGFIYMCMAEAFIDLNQLDSASYYVEKGISFSRQSEEHKELADNLGTKTRLLIKQGKYQQAKPIIEEAIRFREYEDEALFRYYATVLENLGEYKGAYMALKANSENNKKNLISNETNEIASILIEEQFKIEQDKDQLQFQSEIKSQKLWAAIALLSLFLTMIAGYLYLQMRNSLKLRQLNHSLTLHNQALEQFAHITSHDLKEPVRNISILTDLLMRRNIAQQFDKEENNYIQSIKSSAIHLYRMIESLKQFTEVSFTKQKSENVNINEVIAIVRQNLSQLILENNTILEFKNPHNIEFVQFPKEMLILTLQNLIQNGIKYNNSDNPQITVSVSDRNQETLFMISDNGIGIDKRFHEQIFIPFKTLRNKFESKSSGLGLSICKNIIENHGGKIWVESEERGLGSNFYFSI